MTTNTLIILSLIFGVLLIGLLISLIYIPDNEFHYNRKYMSDEELEELNNNEKTKELKGITTLEKFIKDHHKYNGEIEKNKKEKEQTK